MTLIYGADADLSSFPYKDILCDIIHVTNSNDEAWLSDLDLFNVCCLFRGNLMVYGEFSNTLKLMLR